MATVFRSRLASEPRSGGKVVRGRRVAAPRTPYERPRLTNPGASENPSWLSRLFYSPTRLIASGAGKILSTVFSPEPSSSSSSASSSGGDSSSGRCFLYYNSRIGLEIGCWIVWWRGVNSRVLGHGEGDHEGCGNSVLWTIIMIIIWWSCLEAEENIEKTRLGHLIFWTIICWSCV